MGKWIAFVLCFAAIESFAVTLYDSLYINAGNFVTVDGNTFLYRSFNSTPDFVAQNMHLNLNPGDSLVLLVYNNDLIDHGFAVQGFPEYDLLLSPGESQEVVMTFSNPANLIYFDPTDYPLNRYMGLAGMICIHFPQAEFAYYWNIKEHEQGYNDSIAGGIPVDFNTYRPDYFTINGWSFPDLQNDPDAHIQQSVGDVIHIFVANTGQSSHSLHFHGFHVTAIYSSENLQLNRSKDTYPLHSMQSAVLALIPDKPGNYSVHDHNLVAVSGGGTHPNGMFTIMEISE